MWVVQKKRTTWGGFVLLGKKKKGERGKGEAQAHAWGTRGGERKLTCRSSNRKFWGGVMRGNTQIESTRLWTLVNTKEANNPGGGREAWAGSLV